MHVHAIRASKPGVLAIGVLGSRALLGLLESNQKAVKVTVNIDSDAFKPNSEQQQSFVGATKAPACVGVVGSASDLITARFPLWTCSFNGWRKQAHCLLC